MGTVIISNYSDLHFEKLAYTFKILKSVVVLNFWFTWLYFQFFLFKEDETEGDIRQKHPCI